MISKEKLQTSLTVSICLLLLILVVSICILAWVPPVSRDALVHHLTVPTLWIKHGGIYEIPNLIFSYYPMNLDLLYLIPLYFGNDIVPKYLHFAFALATSWLIFTYLKKRLDMLYAILGVLFFLSTPVIVKLSITAYVDLGLVYFSTAGLIFALKWYQAFPRIKYLIMAGLFCGLALGTKYNGLMVFLLMTILVALIASRKIPDNKATLRRSLLYTLFFTLIAGLLYSPWGIKNYIWTGNPLYPLFDSWFNPSHPLEMESLPPIVFRKLIYQEPWWEIVLVPFRIFFEGHDDSHRYFDGKLNPALLILPVFSFFASNRDRDMVGINFEKGVLAAFSILFVLLVFFQAHMRVRYVAPAIPCLVILSIFGMKNIFLLTERYFTGNTRQVVTGLCLIAVLLSFSPNAIYILEQFRIVAPLQYLSGNISRDQYIEKFRPEYAAIQYSNTFLPPGSKIFALFLGSRGYYSEREMFFDITLFQSIIHKSASSEEMRSSLINKGFTHLLIRFDMFDNWCNNNINQKEKQMVIRLLAVKNSLVFKRKGHGLYRL